MGKGNGKDCKEGAWESHTEIMEITEKAGARREQLNTDSTEIMDKAGA